MKKSGLKKSIPGPSGLHQIESEETASCFEDGGYTWWPVAARHVVELERRRFEKIDDKIPQFGQTVVARKRTWNGKDA